MSNGPLLAGQNADTNMQPETLTEFDVFLCHNVQDKGFVNALSGRLEAHGYRVWLDDDQLMGGGSLT